MTDAALVGRLLDEYHERFVAPADIRVLAGSVDEVRVSYRLALPDGSAQVVRAFRADAPVPLEARGLIAVPMADWLLDRARTLALLEDLAYPAPRPVLTRSGELIGVAGQWLSWATWFVPGDVITPTTAQLRLLGEVARAATRATYQRDQPGAEPEAPRTSRAGGAGPAHRGREPGPGILARPA